MSARGTTNGNQRGSAAYRRLRKLRLLEEFGDGKEAPCCGCGVALTMVTLTVDRVVPGCLGGSYAWGNLRPACVRCNSLDGTAVRELLKKLRSGSLTQSRSVVQTDGMTTTKTPEALVADYIATRSIHDVEVIRHKVIGTATFGHRVAVVIEETFRYAGYDAEYTSRTLLREFNNGHGWRGPTGDTKAVEKKLAAMLELEAQDDHLRPLLTRLIGRLGAEVPLTGLKDGHATEVGQVALVPASGARRRGVVTKVTKTKVEVAYTTASSGGRVYRKSVPAEQAWLA